MGQSKGSAVERRMEPRQGEARPFTFLVDGQPCEAYPGETVAAALYASGRRAWRRSRAGDLRGLLCGMGVCFDCLVTVNGAAGVRACQVQAQPGMEVVTDLAGEGAA